MTKPASAPPAFSSPLLRYGRHDADCAMCHDSMHKPRPVCTCGFDEALAASAQAREVEPKYFDDVLHPDDPRRSPCTAADDTPSKSRANRIRLEKGESVSVAQGDGLLALIDEYWDCAFQEGKEGRTHDTKDGRASRTRHAIEEAIADHARIVAHWKQEYADSCDVTREWIAANTALEASLAACRANEARYLYLRDMWGRWIEVVGTGTTQCGISTPSWRGSWESFDAAIDAARSQP